MKECDTANSFDDFGRGTEQTMPFVGLLVDY